MKEHQVIKEQLKLNSKWRVRRIVPDYLDLGIGIVQNESLFEEFSGQKVFSVRFQEYKIGMTAKSILLNFPVPIEDNCAVINGGFLLYNDEVTMGWFFKEEG